MVDSMTVDIINRWQACGAQEEEDEKGEKMEKEEEEYNSVGEWIP